MRLVADIPMPRRYAAAIAASCRVDGYTADKALSGAKAADPSIPLAFCWSHVRRGFYDLAKATAPIAMKPCGASPPFTR
jgi:transposase